MIKLIQDFFYKLNLSTRRLYGSVSWEFGRYSGRDWLTLFGLIILAVLIIAGVVGFIAFCFLWPLILAWAINNLFGTHIPITFWTWLSIVVIAWAWQIVIGRPLIKLQVDRKKL